MIRVTEENRRVAAGPMIVELPVGEYETVEQLVHAANEASRLQFGSDVTFEVSGNGFKVHSKRPKLTILWDRSVRSKSSK